LASGIPIPEASEENYLHPPLSPLPER